ncbi:uncharacterized protein METZ01_LOCUS285944, partial [marine metagenome]
KKTEPVSLVVATSGQIALITSVPQNLYRWDRICPTACVMMHFSLV